MFCLVDQCLKMEKDKKIGPISTLSKAGQMICCSIRKRRYHFLANQIAGKPVCISCHLIMCWYELTVQCCGSSTFMAEWPSSWGIGMVCLCFQAQSPLREKPGLYLPLGGEASLKRPEIPSPPKKLLANKLKMVSLL